MARLAPGANPRGVTNLIAIPARDGDGEVRGVLVACNMHVKRHVDPTPLRSAGLSFAMFCRNLQAYNAIKEQSERDALTGLHSRARFDADLPSHPRDRRFSIACLYVDVNGPHELNNQKGHDAGDDMLRMVAAQIAERFGTQRSYHIGGDEFVAFVLDEDETDTQRHIDQMKEALAAQGIEVSGHGALEGRSVARRRPAAEGGRTQDVRAEARVLRAGRSRPTPQKPGRIAPDRRMRKPAERKGGIVDGAVPKKRDL